MVTARRRKGPRQGGRDNPSSRPCQHAAGEYRHRARRLRARFRGQPALLQQSLRTLASDCDAARRRAHSQDPSAAARRPGLVTPSLTAVFEVSPETTRSFSRMVRDHLEGQILRFEQRQLLIRAAGRMGIDRFLANLIIAAVQHTQPAAPGAGDPPPASVGGWAHAVVYFLVIQAAIAGALWYVLAP